MKKTIWFVLSLCFVIQKSCSDNATKKLPEELVTYLKQFRSDGQKEPDLAEKLVAKALADKSAEKNIEYEYPILMCALSIAKYYLKMVFTKRVRMFIRSSSAVPKYDYSHFSAPPNKNDTLKGMPVGWLVTYYRHMWLPYVYESTSQLADNIRRKAAEKGYKIEQFAWSAPKVYRFLKDRQQANNSNLIDDYRRNRTQGLLVSILDGIRMADDWVITKTDFDMLNVLMDSVNGAKLDGYKLLHEEGELVVPFNNPHNCEGPSPRCFDPVNGVL